MDMPHEGLRPIDSADRHDNQEAEEFPHQSGREADQTYVLQSPQEFRDDLVGLAAKAVHRANGVVLQIESGPDTNPIYDAMAAAKERGAETRLVYEPKSTGHVSRGQNEGNIYRNRVVRHKGDKAVVRQAHSDRRAAIARLQSLGVITPPVPDSTQRRKSHNHIKLFIVDNVAWLGTMNLRESDFTMSNSMLKITDSRWVKVLSHIYDDSITEGPKPNAVYGEDNEGMQVLFDGGNKDDSVIYDRALSMVDSLQPGDEATIIGQYVPVKMMYGQLLTNLRTKMKRGVKGRFLLPPSDSLHPVKWASRKLQRSVEKQARKIASMTAINLARKTHVKAMLVTRANGEQEVLFGSHNLTSWTVGMGNKELAIWTKDPVIVKPIAELLSELEQEETPRK